MKMRLTAATLFVFGLLSSQLPARTWTDSTGRFTIEADFVELKDGIVRMKKAGGKILDVPLEKLSKTDKEWVRNRTAAKPHTPPLTGKTPILISVPGVSWLPLKTGWGGLLGSGPTYSAPAVTVHYQRNGYRGKSVNVVCAVNIDVKDDADDELLRFSIFHEENLARSGQLDVSWMDPTGQRSLAGQGELEIYLADIKDAEKAISNVVRIPISADAAARKKLEAKYGPTSDEPKADKPAPEKPQSAKPDRSRRRGR